MTLKKRKIAFIGGGHITEIIMGNFIRTQKVIPDQLIVSDPNRERLQGFHNRYSNLMDRDNSEAVAWVSSFLSMFFRKWLRKW